uniref:Uncharacterized protein n=1 Tax=Ralstonia solanacearum TaxID=305 RepID=A0A0S4XJR1_RALSL|nr:protein of unknown function [Ralstonia solanacearum]
MSGSSLEPLLAILDDTVPFVMYRHDGSPP